MTTLDWIIAAHATDVEVDFLKIDVEGAETEVLSGLDLSKNRPRIIVAENTGADTYEGRLLQNGYIFAWFDCLNRFYVRQEDEWRCDLIARPPSVWDRSN